jgi:tetratricopeptide (TPR) repeat protein
VCSSDLEALLDREKAAESLAQFTRALELRKESDKRLWARPLLGVGRAHLKLGRLREAEQPLEEAVRLYTSDTFANIGDVSLARTSLADLLWQQGKRREARQLVQEALDALNATRSDVTLHINRAKQWLQSHPV